MKNSNQNKAFMYIIECKIPGIPVNYLHMGKDRKDSNIVIKNSEKYSIPNHN